MSLPLIDTANPLYCPEVSAHQFVASARLLQASLDDASRFSYLRRLCASFSFSSSQSQYLPFGASRYCTDAEEAALAAHGLAALLDSPRGALVEKLPRATSHAPREEETKKDKTETEAEYDSLSPQMQTHLHSSQTGLLRAPRFKRASDASTLSSSDSSASSDHEIPARPFKKKKRSSSEVAHSSFVLSAKAERLRFPSGGPDVGGWYTSDPVAVENDENDANDEELGASAFWPDDADSEGAHFVKPAKYKVVSEATSTRRDRHVARRAISAEASKGFDEETPDSLSCAVDRLEALLPGVRLRSTSHGEVQSHQELVDLLGRKGHLTPQILTLFRDANVHSVNLTESMAEVEGLNLLRSGILKVFKLPDSFRRLTELTLSDVHLADDDLMNVNELPLLHTLFLGNTHIGDVAIMHLVGLRHTLKHLELSGNDRITDDAVPSFLVMTQLSFLSLKGTSVSVKGLRKLACANDTRRGKLKMILPVEAEAYFSNLEDVYDLKVGPPFLSSPRRCGALTKAALKANLVAHSKEDKYINVSAADHGYGSSKEELRRMLEKLLERRKGDLGVRGCMLAGFN